MNRSAKWAAMLTLAAAMVTGQILLVDGGWTAI